MFAVAYVRRSRDAETDRETLYSQSLRAIAVGRCNKSAQLLFYHPPTKQTISSDDFSLDETLCSGPAFGLKYDGGLYVDKYYDEAETFSPPTHAPSSMVFIKHNHTYIKCKVLTIPDRDSTVYTLQYIHINAIHQHDEKDILDHDPTIVPNQHNPILTTFPSWLKHGNSITLFLNNMAKPHHGTLLIQDNNYYFRHGTRATHKITLLKHFPQCDMDLIKSHQIFEGHLRFKNIRNLHIERSLTSAVANHVSASQLMSHEIPTLITQRHLPTYDKKLWDAAYNEDYDGLQKLPFWHTITEKEYNRIKHKCRGGPSIYGHLNN